MTDRAFIGAKSICEHYRRSGREMPRNPPGTRVRIMCKYGDYDIWLGDIKKISLDEYQQLTDEQRRELRPDQLPEDLNNPPSR